MRPAVVLVEYWNPFWGGRWRRRGSLYGAWEVSSPSCVLFARILSLRSRRKLPAAAEVIHSLRQPGPEAGMSSDIVTLAASHSPPSLSPLSIGHTFLVFRQTLEALTRILNGDSSVVSTVKF